MSTTSDDTAKAGAATVAGEPSWDNLNKSDLPPLFQGLAPVYPLDEGISPLQNERTRWRLAWPPYAQDLKAVVEYMQSAEGVIEANALIYRDIALSILDDINEVLAHNDDIAGNKQTANDSATRATHSYLKWSADKLAAQQSQLEVVLGGGPVKAWGPNVLASRQFGQNYPSDTFREILHYKPQALAPARFWTLTRKLLVSYALATLAIIALVSTAVYWTAKGGHEIWARPPAYVKEPFTMRLSSTTSTAPQATPAVVFSSSEALPISNGNPLYFKVAGTMKIFDTASVQ